MSRTPPDISRQAEAVKFWNRGLMGSSAKRRLSPASLKQLFFVPGAKSTNHLESSRESPILQKRSSPVSDLRNFRVLVMVRFQRALTRPM